MLHVLLVHVTWDERSYWDHPGNDSSMMKTMPPLDEHKLHTGGQIKRIVLNYLGG
uniref:Uncharacterized protein n=1 Tax=Rhizophora mucronata TaxID=61149 RepID=A0A2P2QRG8_RHIMU